jgi:hypothetical protein
MVNNFTFFANFNGFYVCATLVLPRISASLALTLALSSYCVTVSCAATQNFPKT